MAPQLRGFVFNIAISDVGNLDVIQSALARRRDWKRMKGGLHFFISLVTLITNPESRLFISVETSLNIDNPIELVYYVYRKSSQSMT